MIYIVDTYAWIEYFKGSKQGVVLKNLLDAGEDKFIIMECCLAELRGHSLREKMDFKDVYEIVRSNSVILPVLRSTWVKAAEIKHELRKKIKRFGLIDSILVAKQKELNCKIISGDPHFKNLRNVTFISN